MTKNHKTDMAEGAGVVIVGSGLAAVSVLDGLKESGYAGYVTMIGEERHFPYDRPPLSKDVLLNTGAEATILLREQDTYNGPDVELRRGRSVTAIDTTLRCVMLDNGDTVDYEQLVLATGSRPRTLPLLSPATPGVFYLRTLDDALALRVAMREARSLIVIGGGVIGLEVAAVATQRGIATTVIEAGPRLMARAATPLLSQMMDEVHQSHGVTIRCESQPTGFEYGNDSHTVTLSDGSVLIADLIVVGIGVVPEVTLALNAGIVCGAMGIVVDAHGRTNVDGVYAAGEVAYAFNESSGRHDRHESWHHAAAHGRHVGEALAGAEDGYAEICGYWSDQYDLNINVFGSVDGDDLAVRGDIGTRQFAIYHLRQGAIIGITCVNAPKDLRVGKQLVKARAVIAKETLEDTRAALTATGLKAA